MLIKKSFYSPRLVLIAGISAAVIAGTAMPFYFGAFGDSPAALVALPFLLVIAALFIADRKSLLLIILVTRSASDIVLESTRSSIGGQNFGLGAVINACVILLTLALVFEKPKAVPGKMMTLWLGFFLTGLCGIALSPVKGDAFRLYLTWLSNFSIFISAFYVVRSVKDFQFCARLILWSSILPAIYALYDIAANFGAAGEAFRLRSTFMHPNIFAFYLMLVVFLGFYLIKATQAESSVTRNVGRSLYLLFLLALLVLTQTRSAWLACAAVFVAYGMLFERRYLFYITTVSLLSLLVPAIHDRLIDLASGNEIVHQAKLNSFAWRLALWQSALEWMTPGRYLLGYGIGSFRENAPTFFAYSAGIKWDAHNVYVQWFFDVGVLGLATYLWIHGRLIYMLRPLFAIDRLAAFITFSIIISYLLVSFSDNMMFYLSFNWYFWFAVGAACALVCASPGPSAEPVPERRPSRMARARAGFKSKRLLRREEKK